MLSQERLSQTPANLIGPPPAACTVPPTPSNAPSMLKQCRTRLWSFTVDELQPFLLLRLQLALSFFLQFSDALCGNRHGISGDIVTVHNVLKREYEFAVHYLVGAEFADQNRDIV